MRIEVKVPVLPESVAEATLVNWHKKAGQAVKRDENLIDIETDKVVLELPAPNAGVLAEILKPDGSTVTAQEVIAVIDTEGAAAETAPAPPPAQTAAPKAPTAPAPAPRPAQASAAVSSSSTTALPAARKMMADAEHRSRRRHRNRTRRANHQGRRHRRGRIQDRVAQTRAVTVTRILSGGSLDRKARAGSFRARRTSRAARSDVAIAAACRGASGAIAIDSRHPHDLQRGEHGAGARAAQPATRSASRRSTASSSDSWDFSSRPSFTP